MTCNLGFKLAGALVIAVAAAGIADLAGAAIVRPAPLAKNVFVVDTSVLNQPAAQTSAAGSGGATTAAAVIAPVAPLLAAANADAGQKYAKVCGTCHSFNKGEAAKMGPNLYGIIGSKHAHMAGFNYSAAMKALADKGWTFEGLNQFLAHPSVEVPGTKMPFAGIKSDSDRANVIAWLRTLADKPEPLPAK